MNNHLHKILALLLIGLLLIVSLVPVSVGAQALTEDELAQVGGSEVILSGIHQPNAALNPEAPAYGTAAKVSVDGQPFAEALRFTTNVQPASTYLLQYVFPIASRIEKDDVMLATFYARTLSSTVETAEGTASLVMEKTVTFDKSINETITIPNTWKKFLVPIKAALLMEENTPQITFRLGYKPQVIEIADLKVVNYKKAVAFADLPSTPVVYDGMEDNAPWRTEANARIEQIRKGDLTVEVKDASGQPIPNADVHVAMTKHDFKWGTAVNSDKLFGTDADSEMYRTKLKENFNSAVMENDMKWQFWEGNKAKTVNAYNWLGSNGFDIRGHALIWDNTPRLPNDVPGLMSNKPQLEKRIQDHFHELAGFFRGRLYNWDVLNEPVLNSMIRSTYDNPGAVMANWFKMAKEADPTAKLYVNETQILGVDAPVIGTFSNILQSMKDNGAPIDGVGIQAHFGSTPVSPMAFYNQLTHFAQYAPEIAITEFDVNSPKEDIQGKFTHDIMLAAFSHPNVQSFTMWGFWDGSHWQNNAPLFRQNWTLKPSGEAWRDLIYHTWWTDVTGQSDVNGVYQTRGFYGNYDITVTIGGTSQTVKTSLLKGKDNKVTIVWGSPSGGTTAPSFVPLTAPAQTAEITAPVWPYGSVFQASNVSPTSVSLTWPEAHDNQEVAGYKVYQDGALVKELGANVTRLDVTGLTPGHRYSFTVQALDAQGNTSVMSQPIDVTAVSGADTELPGWKKGSLLDVADLGQTGAKLSWPAGVDNDGTEGYRLYVNGQLWSDTSDTQYTLTGLTHNKLYTVRVESKDGDGNLSVGGPIVTFRTLGAADTAAPVWVGTAALTASDVTQTSVGLSWPAAQDSYGVTAYRVYQDGREIVTLPASSRSFGLAGLTPHTAYAFRVEAGDAAGNWSVVGPTLTVTTAAGPDTTAPAWPPDRSLTYSGLTDRAVTLNWTPAVDSIGVTGYKVYANNQVIATVDGNATSYAVTNLTAGTTYAFRVQAGDAAGNWTANGPSVSVRTFDGVVRKQTIYYPSDDAFIQAPATVGGAGTTNNLEYLRYKNAAGASGTDANKNTGNNRRAYLKFPLTSVTGNVYDASLNLYISAVQSPNMDIPMNLYSTGDNWTESTINWLNKPTDGAMIGSTVIRNALYWKKFDVTAQTALEVSGDKTISFKLQDDAWLDQNVDMHSKEATGANVAYRPYLSVGTEELPVDGTAPAWPGANLSVSQLAPHALALSWTSAQDTVGVNRYKVYQNGVPIATVAADVYSYQVSGLKPATNYTFKVEAMDAASESTTGPSTTLTTPAADLVHPTWPSGSSVTVTVTDAGRYGLTLHWPIAADNYGVTGYDVYQGSTLLGTVSGTINQYAVTGLTPGTSYTFHVDARDAEGNTASSQTLTTATAAADTAKPGWGAGSGLSASLISDSGMQLNWPAATDDTGVTGYRIEQDGTTVIEVSQDIRSYWINGLQAAHPYMFTVRALDQAGNASDPLQAEVTTLQVDTITPQWPTGSRVTASRAGDQVTLTWDAAIDNIAIKQYLIYRNGVQVAQVDGGLITYTLQDAASDSVYKIEAQDLVGTATVFGPATNDALIPVPTDTTAPGWPAGSRLTAQSVGQTSITVSWSEAIDRMGVKEYRLELNGNPIATTAQTFWQVTGLAEDSVYTFKVEAVDEAGNWSTNGPTLAVRTASTDITPAPSMPNQTASPAGSNIINVPAHTVSGGKSVASVDKAALEAAFKSASAGRVVVDLAKAEGAKAYELQLPASFLTEQAGGRSLQVKTTFGTLLLPSSLFAGNPAAEKSSALTVSIASADRSGASQVPGTTGAVVELSITAGDQQPLSFNGKSVVEVRIPYQPTAQQRSHSELLNVWYVDGSGNAQLMPTGRYDVANGEMVFSTPHFSTYAVSYVKPAFEDVSRTPWAQQAIEALAAKGIIQGVSESAFHPSAAVTRADFTKLLVETFGLKANVQGADAFADASQDAYYAQAVAIAHQLGVVNGQTATQFAPQALISRQEMFTMIARALAQTDAKLPSGAGKSLPFTDAGEIAPYAKDAIAAMASQGFIEGDANLLHPLSNSTRAEAAVMLYRMFKHVYQP
ncbi:fibronectin type III domain-containing protein [Paenibacillus whitsoniae]|uniref:fibronectin type III domain-containing protein n=1 Tax=Paenibacillus whitsoniae TaxID=2496558 RepID=UPI0013DF9775|nr:fibronectin type III domain-containing protein [Paenibacillus whitsoniae]